MNTLARIFDKLQDVSHFLHTYCSFSLAAIAVCFLVALVLLRLGGEAIWSPLAVRCWQRLALFLTLAFGGLLLGSSLACSVNLGMNDHVEPSVISNSWLFGHGKPAYPRSDAAEHYAMPYGPMVYYPNALSMLAFGGDVRVIKLLGFVLLLLGLALMGATTRYNGASWTSVIYVLGYAAAGIMLIQDATGTNSATWPRADPHLLFWSCFGYACGTLRRPMLAAVGIGIAMGFSVAIKAHGAVYLLPVLVPLFRQSRAKGLVVCAVTASAAFLLPFFLVWDASLPRYFEINFRVAGDNGFSRQLLVEVSRRCVFLLMPVVALFLHNVASSEGPKRRECLRQHLPHLIAITLTTLLIFVPATKVCNLPYHLLPLVPGYAMVLGVMLAWPCRTGLAPHWVRNAALASVISFAVVGISTSFVLAHTLCGWACFDHQTGRAARAEILDVCHRYPGMSVGMGYGDNTTYCWTWYRTELVFRGQPDILDGCLLMDASFPMPEATRDAIRKGVVRVWLVPTGDEPFTLTSFFPGHNPVFDDSFRSDFRTHYQRRERTEHYDVWVYADSAKESHSSHAAPMAANERAHSIR